VFNVGPAEVLMILVVALLVLGPKKLPEAARQMGKAMAEFRRVTSGLQDEVRGVLEDHFEEPKPVEHTAYHGPIIEAPQTPPSDEPTVAPLADTPPPLPPD
jgi:sec-independent protein translocase protein TatA